MSEKHTAECRKLLPPEFQSQFSVLAQVFERPSKLWAFLALLVWSFMTKYYVIGFQDRDRALYLFRLPGRFHGAGQATGSEKLDVQELRELDCQERLLVTTLSFRKPDGKKVKLFAPEPSRENATEIYQAMRTKT